MKKLYPILIIILLITCSCNKTPENKKVYKFEIIGKSDTILFKVNKSGEIFSKELLIGKFENNNTLKDNSNFILFNVEDGFLYDYNHNQIGEIDKNGKLENKNYTLEWNKKGEFIKDGKKSGIFLKPAHKILFKPATMLLYSYLEYDVTKN
ncbi:hypothetical protein [Flavobacterium sp. NRK F7]|uniref:hypothetical protein n=1 Tax=Flavobacterium sp. NRK F7 TaxID=2954930 RepID=UPI002090CAEB|nr:hypothetical protein [Flavobacterium sp. NRK F7]MCO6162556.1 hypothetical protein [Flavobacterium sp. NRK F7]